MPGPLRSDWNLSKWRTCLQMKIAHGIKQTNDGFWTCFHNGEKLRAETENYITWAVAIRTPTYFIEWARTVSTVDAWITSSACKQIHQLILFAIHFLSRCATVFSLFYLDALTFTMSSRELLATPRLYFRRPNFRQLFVSIRAANAKDFKKALSNYNKRAIIIFYLRRIGVVWDRFVLLKMERRDLERSASGRLTFGWRNVATVV